MAFLNIKNLSFAYPGSEFRALSEINFLVDEGSFVLLCGQSGCGKSTLLKHFKKELVPHGVREGEVLYCDKPLLDMDKMVSAEEIGFVMQNIDNQIVTDKVYAELAFGLESLGLENSVIRRRVSEMASFFGIHKWFRQKTSTLSGGQKQMLNLASVMLMQPKLLILDEPTSQLDPIAAAEFLNTIVRINRSFGTTVIMTEHRLEEVFPHADKIIVLDGGQLIEQGSPKEAATRLALSEKKHCISDAFPSAVRLFSAINQCYANNQISAINQYFDTNQDLPINQCCKTSQVLVANQVSVVKINEECPLTIKEGRNFVKNLINKNTNKNNVISKVNNPEKIKQKSVDKNNKVSYPLVLKEVFFRYEKNAIDILHGTDLTVYPNELLCILGGNGTGKTTTLSLIGGIHKAYRGKIQIFGKDIEKYKGGELYECLLSALPQNPQTLFTNKTVKKELEDITRDENAINNAVNLLGIESLLNNHPYDISGGEQQKVAFAKVLLTKPRIILLDEPTKGLDAHYKKSFGELLKKLTLEGVTVIMATHDIEFAAKYASRCSLFFDGELSAPESPQEFFTGNYFYTTAANRIARSAGLLSVTVEQLAEDLAYLLNF